MATIYLLIAINIQSYSSNGTIVSSTSKYNLSSKRNGEFKVYTFAYSKRSPLLINSGEF